MNILKENKNIAQKSFSSFWDYRFFIRHVKVYKNKTLKLRKTKFLKNVLIVLNVTTKYKFLPLKMTSSKLLNLIVFFIYFLQTNTKWVAGWLAGWMYG